MNKTQQKIATACANARKPYADEIKRLIAETVILSTALRQITDEETFTHSGKQTAAQGLANAGTIARDALLRFQQS